jgi:hypothetical protein
MMRDIAEMNLAYFFYDYAQHTGKEEDYREALDLMYSYYRKRAEHRELPILIDLSSKTGNEELLREIASYYKLGSYFIDGTSFYYYK